MVATRFEELQVWQKARAMNQGIYQLTRQRSFSRDFGFIDQMRRASISVMNNIAEGFERYRRNEFLQYLSTAKGSAGEVRSMLYAAYDLEYMDKPTFDAHLNQITELGASIGRFRQALEKSPPKPLRRLK